MEILGMDQLLAQSGVYSQLFDIVRLVDAQAGKVFEMQDGHITQTAVNCVDVFGSTERCKNCTSIRSLYTNEQVVKLEYVGGAVLLIVSAPIEHEGRTVVVELVKNITNSMTVDNKDAYRADEVSVIIDRFNKLATTDTLTGLMNRRFIDDHLPNLLESGKLLGKPTSVAMIDIDHFKKVNDTYGHQAGDLVLSGVAGLLHSYIRRESDFAARYGGEEFLLCFPGTKLADCREICERVRANVEETPFRFEGRDIQITVSAGVSESEELAQMNQDKLIALADERLYTAKEGGRNRVV